MGKTILVTGSTDGLGLRAARKLASLGHRVLLHGRNPAKLAGAVEALSEVVAEGRVEAYLADLSRFSEVSRLAEVVCSRHDRLDALINNAGVFGAPVVVTEGGLDLRFVVNAIAPYLLTRRLLGCMDGTGRVINVSSAAQRPVELGALAGHARLSDLDAYAQSKLAITAWSRVLADELGEGGPAVVAVNPGSMLGTKMVREAFGVAGRDVDIGAELLVRAALDQEFAAASGLYFDNDAGRFGGPHPDVLDPLKGEAIVRAIEAILQGI